MKKSSRGTFSALFPGTFDPLTNGHADLIQRALEIYDHLLVAVLHNPEKKTCFTVQERVKLIRSEVKKYGSRVSVQSFSGLLVDFAKQNNIRVILRGLRAVSDYDYEAQMALINKNLDEHIETFFLMAREENSYISSSLVRQVAVLGGDISKFVSPGIEGALKKRLRTA